LCNLGGLFFFPSWRPVFLLSVYEFCFSVVAVIILSGSLCERAVFRPPRDMFHPGLSNFCVGMLLLSLCACRDSWGNHFPLPGHLELFLFSSVLDAFGRFPLLTRNGSSWDFLDLLSRRFPPGHFFFLPTPNKLDLSLWLRVPRFFLGSLVTSSLMPYWWIR